MSPEQAEGKPVDARSDIFSFGAVLYEMATGRKAFQGDSVLSTLSAILRENPKPPRAVAEEIPHDLEKIILRCLRKDPERRFQNMADVKVELQEIKEEMDSGALAPVQPAEGGGPCGWERRPWPCCSPRVGSSCGNAMERLRRAWSRSPLFRETSTSRASLPMATRSPFPGTAKSRTTLTSMSN
jgi:serine/threonine protein kinase